MNVSAIRVRYAKAFFSLAREKNLIEPLKTDIENVLSVCNQSSDFRLFLGSPLFSSEKKAGLIAKIFAGKINTLTLNFLQLIIQNKREVFIPEICLNFLELIKKELNIKSAFLITATEINPAIINKIKNLMENELQSTVELESQVDPEIVGGLILRVGDIRYDASVKLQLKNIKHDLLITEFR